VSAKGIEMCGSIRVHNLSIFGIGPKIVPRNPVKKFSGQGTDKKKYYCFTEGGA